MSRSGFGLLELILALTLLSVGVLALAAAALTAQQNIATADATERAARTAAMVLDSLMTVASPASGSRSAGDVTTLWTVAPGDGVLDIALEVGVRDGRRVHRFRWDARHVAR